MADTLTYKDMYEQFGRNRIAGLARDSDYTGLSILSGSLTTGVRYEFITVGTDADFENLGSEAKADLAAGQYFYATSTGAPTAWGTGTVIYAGMSPVDITENELENCRSKFESIADYCDATFTESDTQIQLAMKYFTFYLLCLRSQNEKQGEGEYNVAISTLTELWGNAVIDYFKGNPRPIEQVRDTNQKVSAITNVDYTETIEDIVEYDEDA